MQTVQQWSMAELAFQSAQDVPDAATHIRVVFTGPNGARVMRPGFWDGGRTWRVRFAVPEVGRWRWSTECSDPTDRGLHGLTGEAECAAADGSGPLKHGFLEAARSGRHLQHRDGTPFFWLGDTHWRMAWERWDEANKPGWSSQFRETIDLRVRQGFSVYQSNILSWTPPAMWERFVRGEVDTRFFREVLDPRFAYIASRGLVHAVGLGWYHAVDGSAEAVVRFAREVVARYGAYPVVWTLGGEVAGYDPELREARLAAWREVAIAIDEDDDYGHPITAHLTNERPFRAVYQDEPWLTFTLNQLGHGDRDMSSTHWTDHLASRPGKPLIEGESFYEGLTSVEPTGRRPVTATMVRQVAYRAIQSGCSGYTYGGQGCWNGVWDDSEPPSMWGAGTWASGVDLPGAAQVGHLRAFYTSLDWTALRAAPEMFRTGFWTNEYFYAPLVTADAERATVVAYFGETYRHDDDQSAIIGLAATPYRVDWYDPRTGAWIDVAMGEMPERGAISIPRPPADGDWVLVLRRD